MFKRSLLSLMLIGAGALGYSAMPAAALSLPIQQPAPTVDTSSPMTVQIADRRVNRDRRVYRYDRYRHGPRCTRWGNHCRYYHRGYYYGSPWWTFPAFGTGIVIGGAIGSPYYYNRYPRYRNYGNRHVEWCLDRYRSYSVRTNTFVTYSGEVRQCRSPYWP